MKLSTVSINGTVYDKRTGKPLRKERGLDDPTRHSAHNVHMQLQHSTTLNRRYVHHGTSPVASPHIVYAPQRQRMAAPNATTIHRTSVAARPTHNQSVAHFAKQRHHTTNTPINDIGPARHASVQRAKSRIESNRPSERVIKPSQILKNEAIAEAMAKSEPKKSGRHRTKSTTHRNKFTRFMSIASASMAVLVLGAYFTYLNMPALSTRVAAAQAGINATYPGYMPSGYSLNGPVAYQQGSVAMKFAANAGPQNYTLSQTHSGWDSTALLDDYVSPQAGNNYITTTTGGLTIYSYNTTSVWVNNGILYTINGNSTLSDEQIQRIAASL